MYKILIVEDDLAMAQAIQKEMKMWGMKRSMCGISRMYLRHLQIMIRIWS